MTNDMIFSALSDGTRRQVLEHLAAGPRSVGEIAALMPVSRSAVSQHLGQLKGAGLARERRDGVKRIYRVDPQGIAHLRAWIDDLWRDALENLKMLSEAEHGRRTKRGRTDRKKLRSVHPLRSCSTCSYRALRTGGQPQSSRVHAVRRPNRSRSMPRSAVSYLRCRRQASTLNGDAFWRLIADGGLSWPDTLAVLSKRSSTFNS